MFEMLADREIGFGGLCEYKAWQACLCNPTSDIIGRSYSISTPDCILFTASATKRNFLLIIKHVRKKLKPQDHIRSLLMRSIWGPKTSTQVRDSNHGPSISRTLFPLSTSAVHLSLYTSLPFLLVS